MRLGVDGLEASHHCLVMNRDTLSTGLPNPILAVQAAYFSVLVNQPGRFLSYALSPGSARYDSNKDFSRIILSTCGLIIGRVGWCSCSKNKRTPGTFSPKPHLEEEGRELKSSREKLGTETAESWEDRWWETINNQGWELQAPGAGRVPGNYQGLQAKSPNTQWSEIITLAAGIKNPQQNVSALSAKRSTSLWLLKPGKP